MGSLVEKCSGGGRAQGDGNKVPGGRLTPSERKGTTSSEVEGEESIPICM